MNLEKANAEMKASVIKLRKANLLLRMEIVSLKAKLRCEFLSYSYYDGFRMVTNDLLPIWKRFWDVSPEIMIDLKVSKSLDVYASKCGESAESSMRSIFNIRSFSEGGLACVEVIRLFNHFNDYCDGLLGNK